MKQLIVLVAVTVFLLTFPLQYALEQKNHHNISEFQKYINIAKEKAKAEGYFTNDIINELKTNILNEFDNISESEIVIDVTSTPKYRTSTFDSRELIHYRIGVPIKKIIASNLFWGISEDENKFLYEINNYTTSELNRP